MRIGGEIKRPYSSPEEWIALVKEMRYSTVLCPIDSSAPSDVRRLYRECAERNDVVIGEVGVWRNTLSQNDAERRQAMDYAKAQLQLAEEMGARCCVNIAGNRGEGPWDGFSAVNYAEDTFALIVDMVREIIDAVKPKNTFYSLEPMPWMTPDSPEEYLRLIKAVDRPAFAVHLDYVNMISSPRRYFDSIGFITECFRLLGPYIKSIHAKDVIMDNAYTTIIHEVMPGKGVLDYTRILPLAEALGKDTPVFVEHLPDWESYCEAAAYIRSNAQKAGIEVIG